jgi:hypothetical protein
LKLPWFNKQLACYDLTLRKKYKVSGLKYGNYGAGRTIIRLFPLSIIESRGGNGSFADGLAKNKFCTDMLGLLSLKTTLNFCKGLMNVSCSDGFTPWDVVRWLRQSFSW